MTTIERRIEIAATPEAVFDTLRPRLAGTIDSTVTMSVTPPPPAPVSRARSNSACPGGSCPRAG